MHRNTTLLLATAALLGANLGYMIASGRAQTFPVLQSAQAGVVMTTASGDLLTTSQDGSRIYIWYNARNNAPTDTYKALEFQY